MFQPYDKQTASPADRVAWALCQIIDDDAPMRWTRYRFAAECIAKNPELMADLQTVSGSSEIARLQAQLAEAVAHQQSLFTSNSLQQALVAELAGVVGEMVNLCAVGDVDESTEAYGWGEVIKSANAALAKVGR